MLGAVSGLFAVAGCLRATPESTSDTATTTTGGAASTPTTEGAESTTEAATAQTTAESEGVAPAAAFWKRTLPATEKPAYADGRLFSAHNKDDETQTPTVRRLSTETGEDEWETELPADPHENNEITGFVADGDSVWVSNQFQVARIDATDGSVAWRREVGTFAGIGKAGDRLLVPRDPPIDGSAVRCLSAADGSDVWEAELDAGPTGNFVTTADSVVVSLWDDRVESVSLADGSTQWVDRYGPEDGWFALAANQSTVFTTWENNPVVALDPARNEQRWEYDTSLTGDTTGRPVGLSATEDAVYLSVNSLSAIDAGDGTPKWSTSGIANTSRRAEADGEFVYCYGDYDYGEDQYNIETFFRLGRETGRVEQTYPTPFRPERYPYGFVVGEDAVYARLYANGEQNQLLAIKKRP